MWKMIVALTSSKKRKKKKMNVTRFLSSAFQITLTKLNFFLKHVKINNAILQTILQIFAKTIFKKRNID